MSLTSFGQFRVIVDIYNVSCTAATPILTPSLLKTPSSSNAFSKQQPIALFIIYSSYQNQGNLSIVRTEKDGTVLTAEILNSTAINANTLSTFVFPVSPGEGINIQYSVNTTANRIVILELMER